VPVCAPVCVRVCVRVRAYVNACVVLCVLCVCVRPCLCVCSSAGENESKGGGKVVIGGGARASRHRSHRRRSTPDGEAASGARGLLHVHVLTATACVCPARVCALQPPCALLRRDEGLGRTRDLVLGLAVERKVVMVHRER
jgi:hypothetical protein